MASGILSVPVTIPALQPAPVGVPFVGAPAKCCLLDAADAVVDVCLHDGTGSVHMKIPIVRGPGRPSS